MRFLNITGESIEWTVDTEETYYIYNIFIDLACFSWFGWSGQHQGYGQDLLA